MEGLYLTLRCYLPPTRAESLKQEQDQQLNFDSIWKICLSQSLSANKLNTNNPYICVFMYLGSCSGVFIYPFIFFSLYAVSNSITKMWLQYKNLIQFHILLLQTKRDGSDSGSSFITGVLQSYSCKTPGCLLLHFGFTIMVRSRIMHLKSSFIYIYTHVFMVFIVSSFYVYCQCSFQLISFFNIYDTKYYSC